MISITTALVAVILLLSTACLAAADQVVTIYAWPMSAASPQELAKITYNQAPLAKPSISDLNLPAVASTPGDSKELVRVGLYDQSTKEWRGVVTAASSFNTEYQILLSLHLDSDGVPWHLGISAYPRPKSGQKIRRQGEPIQLVPQVIAEVVTPKPGPTPHLNKPVVLSADGKIPEKEPEKTFIQKYWWAIAIFLAVQVFAAGGKE